MYSDTLSNHCSYGAACEFYWLDQRLSFSEYFMVKEPHVFSFLLVSFYVTSIYIHYQVYTWMAGEKLVCSTRNPVWCSVMTWRDGMGEGRELRKERCSYNYDWFGLLYGRKQYNIAKIKIFVFKFKKRKMKAKLNHY